MSFFKSILLGIVQGITEFFPISSSGHLVVIEHLFGVETEYHVFFRIVLHMGTLLAVSTVFRREISGLIYAYKGLLVDIWKNFLILLQHVFQNREKTYHKVVCSQYRKLALMILLGNIPTAVIGLVLRKFVYGNGSSLFVAGFGLLVTGLFLFVTGFIENGKKMPKNASISSSFVVGICQGFSVIPGISRLGTTMAAGVLSGYNRTFALKYSYLIGMPSVIGAFLLELSELPNLENLTLGFVACCIVGAAVAAVTGFFTIRAFIQVVQKRKLRVFSYYCFFAGIIIVLLNYVV